MLQGANTDLFNPLVPKAHNSQCRNRLFPNLQVIKGQDNLQSWALLIFLNVFNNKKWFFASFIKYIWFWVGFLNGTGAEIGY